MIGPGLAHPEQPAVNDQALPKPCPWCNETPIVKDCETPYGKQFAVDCSQLGFDCPAIVSTLGYDTKQEAIAVWNKGADRSCDDCDARSEHEYLASL